MVLRDRPEVASYLLRQTGRWEDEQAQRRIYTPGSDSREKEDVGFGVAKWRTDDNDGLNRQYIEY